MTAPGKGEEWAVYLVAPEDGMSKPRQLHMHDPEAGTSGDCYRTAIACLLGLQAEDVPHFVDQARDGGHWEHMRLARHWLRERGRDLAAVKVKEMREAGGAYIGSVESHRGPWRHAVVFLGDELWCDPSGLDDYTVDELADPACEVLCLPYEPGPDEMVEAWAQWAAESEQEKI